MYFREAQLQMERNLSDDAFDCIGWDTAMQKNREDTLRYEDAAADFHPRANEAIRKVECSRFQRQGRRANNQGTSSAQRTPSVGPQ